jgi:hypothetical protein
MVREGDSPTLRVPWIMDSSPDAEDGVMLEGQLSGLLTSAIARVRLINYVQPGGHRQVGEGPIEFTLDNGTVLRLESGSDGESIRLCVGEWTDPFAEPLTPENREFVARSGKWTAFDVSSEKDYSRLIGQTLNNLGLILGNGKVTGVSLLFGSTSIRAEVDADELSVDIMAKHDE